MATRSEPLAAVGVIGLGLMGTALTERLLDAGYPVCIYNRTREKATPLLARGAVWSDNPIAAADRVIVSLYTTDVVARVLADMAAAFRPGKIVIDTTTGDPEATAALARRLAAKGVEYLDAPLSGSSAQTRRGEVTAIVGGPRETLDACRDLFDLIATKTLHVGLSGSGAKMKLVTNLVLGLNRAALAEGLAFAKAMGLEMEAALAVLIDSFAYSRTMDSKGQKMIAGDFRTQAKLSQHLKDVRLILDAAARNGLQLPVASLHRQLLEQLEADGLGELDNCAIIRAYIDR